MARHTLTGMCTDDTVYLLFHVFCLCAAALLTLLAAAGSYRCRFTIVVRSRVGYQVESQVLLAGVASCVRIWDGT